MQTDPKGRIVVNGYKNFIKISDISINLIYYVMFLAVQTWVGYIYSFLPYPIL